MGFYWVLPVSFRIWLIMALSVDGITFEMLKIDEETRSKCAGGRDRRFFLSLTKNENMWKPNRFRLPSFAGWLDSNWMTWRPPLLLGRCSVVEFLSSFCFNGHFLVSASCVFFLLVHNERPLFEWHSQLRPYCVIRKRLWLLLLSLSTALEKENEKNEKNKKIPKVSITLPRSGTAFKQRWEK